MLTAPSAPITAISAVGYAKFMSARICLEFITQYAPPYAFRVMTVTFGTVASANANSSFAPCLMMPPYSWTVPGRKPGTSSKVTSGMLNASQNRTNRAPFTEASISSVPASTAGWFATIPTVRRIAHRRARRVLQVVAGHEGQEVANQGEALAVVVHREMRDAAGGVV